MLFDICLHVLRDRDLNDFFAMLPFESKCLIFEEITRRL